MWDIPGRISLRSCTCFAWISRPVMVVSPVMFPPGRPRLWISLSSTGFPLSMTIGIVCVTSLAAESSWSRSSR